jgi:hypothetical protein
MRSSGLIKTKLNYMYEFEKHPKLTEFIQEMANTGRVPQEWTTFLETLNQALRIHDVVGQSEQLTAFAEYCDEKHGLFIPSWMIDGYNKSR